MDINIKQKAFNSKVFKALDIRGLYPEELDHNTVEIIVISFAEYLMQSGAGKTCLVGEDVRWSSPEISEIVKRELIGRGIDVIDIGLATSPFFVFCLSKSGASGGMMVTASHNSIRYNGLKLYKGVQPLSENKGLREIKEIISSGIKKYDGAFGSIKKENYLGDYTDFLFKSVNIKRNMKAVFDAGGGSTGYILKSLLPKFSNIDAKVILADPDPSLLKRETNPMFAGAQTGAREEIIKSRAEVGFVFDPDGDRVVVLDELGEMVRSDAILWLLAKKFVHAGEGIAYDASRASRFLAEDLSADSIRFHKSRVGHSFVTDVMRLEDAVLGGELSGHFYFKDFFYADAAIFAAIKVLDLLSQSKQKLSELVKPFFKYVHSDEINFEVKSKEEIILMLEAKYPDAERDYFDGATFRYSDWWFNVRPSNTEDLLRLILEANTKSIFDAKKDELFGLLFSKGAKLD